MLAGNIKCLLSGHVSALRLRAHHPRGHLRSPEPGRPRPAPIPAAVPAFPTQAAAAVTTATGASLAVGNSLSGGQPMVSPNGRYSLVMGADGTLAYQNAPHRLNSSAVSGKPGHRGNVPRFSTNTFENLGAAAILHNDGNVVVYANTTAASPLFITGTGTAMGANTLLAAFQGELKILPPDVTALYGSARTPTTVLPGQMLFPGDRRMSPGRNCQLIMQTDVNLMHYCNDRLAFASRTGGIPWGPSPRPGSSPWCDPTAWAGSTWCSPPAPTRLAVASSYRTTATLSSTRRRTVRSSAPCVDRRRQARPGTAAASRAQAGAAGRLTWTIVSRSTTLIRGRPCGPPSEIS